LDIPPLGLPAKEFLASPPPVVPAGWIAPVKVMARVDRVKGLHVLAEALERVDECVVSRVRVAMKESLENQDPSYEAAVRQSLAGVLVTGERSKDWFQPGDTVVIPSLQETVCLVAHEAMARGCLVVAPAVGDLRSVVIEEVSGLTFEAGDSESLARALKRAVELSAEERRELIAEGFQRAKARAGHWYEGVTAALLKGGRAPR
jgi:glycosyltransferase involved in cell wall biosynthesis